MHPINFEGAIVIKKPENMSDEECMSIYAMPVIIDYSQSNQKGRMWVEAWKPNKEDIEAINRGEPVWVQIHSVGLPPIALFTIDENGNSNDAG